MPRKSPIVLARSSKTVVNRGVRSRFTKIRKFLSQFVENKNMHFMHHEKKVSPIFTKLFLLKPGLIQLSPQFSSSILFRSVANSFYSKMCSVRWLHSAKELWKTLVWIEKLAFSPRKMGDCWDRNRVCDCTHSRYVRIKLQCTCTCTWRRRSLPVTNVCCIYVTFHRKTCLIAHFNLGQTLFQTPSNSVCKAFAKGLEKVWNAFKRVCRAFERVWKEFVKRLKAFERSL